MKFQFKSICTLVLAGLFAVVSPVAAETTESNQFEASCVDGHGGCGTFFDAVQGNRQVIRDSIGAWADLSTDFYSAILLLASGNTDGFDAYEGILLTDGIAAANLFLRGCDPCCGATFLATFTGYVEFWVLAGIAYIEGEGSAEAWREAGRALGSFLDSIDRCNCDSVFTTLFVRETSALINATNAAFNENFIKAESFNDKAVKFAVEIGRRFGKLVLGF